MVNAVSFRRLLILDLTSAGHQPTGHKATGDCLIFNGEIYNFRWLRAKLGARRRSAEHRGAQYVRGEPRGKARRRVTSGRDLRSLGLEPKSLGLSEQYLPASAFDAFTDPAGDPFNAVSQAESFLYMGNTLLRDADVNSMAHSLKIRVPFLGRWLVDLVGAIPGSVKAPKGAPPKHLLRKAAGAQPGAIHWSRPLALVVLGNSLRQ